MKYMRSETIVHTVGFYNIASTIQFGVGIQNNNQIEKIQEIQIITVSPAAITKSATILVITSSLRLTS